MSKLNGEVKLTVPQLRAYLADMTRIAVEYDRRGSRISASSTLHGMAEGTRRAKGELLMALNLPEDWETQMDRLEEAEARRGP